MPKLPGHSRDLDEYERCDEEEVQLLVEGRRLNPKRSRPGGKIWLETATSGVRTYRTAYGHIISWAEWVEELHRLTEDREPAHCLWRSREHREYVAVRWTAPGLEGYRRREAEEAFIRRVHADRQRKNPDRVELA